jgi:hypothetical protein
MSTVNPYVPPSGPPAPPAAVGPKPGPSLDFGRCLGFFFQDPNWVQKILVGSLFTILSMFLVGGIFIAGYAARLVRNAARGEPYPLPDWDDLGGMFVEGLGVVGAYLAHVVPVALLMLVAILPMALLSEGEGEPNPAVALFLIPLFFVAFLLLLAMIVYFTAAFTRLAIAERFGAAFEVGENLAFLRRNVGNLLMALLALMVSNFIAQFAILLFCIGIIPATFWSQCVAAYALGEVAHRDPG